MKKIINYLAVVSLGSTCIGSTTSAQPSLQNNPPVGVMDVQIQQAVRKHRDHIINLRHHIHQYPELSNREFKTAQLVAEHLRALDFEVRTGIAHTGVVGILKGGKPGPVVAVRADMDALPVTEKTDFLFKSTVRTTAGGHEVGVMHACGHDIHTAVQLGVASVLAELRDDIPGTVLFIFQPAEEGAPAGEEGGASLMLEEGVFEDPRPEAIFGLHASAGMPVGTVGYTIGPALAAVDHFYLTIKGTQSHAAAPHRGVDPVVMAAQIVMALQTIPSRSLDPIQPSVVTVGMIHGGEKFNIIPEEVQLEGTVRSYDEGVRDTVERRMREIADGITRAGGGSFTLDYGRGTPPTINDPELSNKMVPTLMQVLDAENVIEDSPTMGGEDFAYFALEIPGFFYWLGIVKEGTVCGPIHSPTFRADDDAVPVGMRVMSNLLIDYLYNSPGGQ